MANSINDRLRKEYLEMISEISKIHWPPAPPSGHIASNPNTLMQPDSFKLRKMVYMRMHWEEGQRLPMPFMEAHKSDEKVFVFLVHNGQPVVIEDEWNLFPSDALVTKLRIIIG